MSHDRWLCHRFGDNSTCEVGPELKHHYCINVLQNTSSGVLEVKWGGCLKDIHCRMDEVTHNECDVYRHKEDKKDLFFCCCIGNFCNNNIVVNETKLEQSKLKTTAITNETRPPESPNGYKMFYYSFPPVVGTIIVITFLIYLIQRHKRQMNAVKRPLIHPGRQSTPPTTRPVSWICAISRGQFGCVWRATYQGNDVAVKIIQAQEKASWETERNMYQNCSLVHENILKFYGAEKRLLETTQYWIITQYHSHGSLSDYLRSAVLDFEGMLRLMISMVRGLVFLHTENLSLNPQKPIIAHRDFKSRNVLVKEDLTCCISDFGSACLFAGSYESEDTKTQVGTKRYMAPEVLQGAIAFQAESFLNIDVYALGLVMWELLSRCQFSSIPFDHMYKVPFELEVGLRPSIEDMKTCVLDKNLRPIIKPGWRRMTKTREICDTIEECWDDEPDARLSSPCVLMRLQQLQEMSSDDISSEASSGFVESSFMHDEVPVLSNHHYQHPEESSCSSAIKDPQVIELS